LHTGFASDADTRVELDDAIVTLIHGCDGADAHARRVGAMVAARHLKAAAHIGKRACLDILDPRAVHTQRHLIFGLTRGAARVTSNALALVNEEAVIHHRYAACGGVTAFMIAVVKSVGVTPGD
jgi:hypothetical protein